MSKEEDTFVPKEWIENPSSIPPLDASNELASEKEPEVGMMVSEDKDMVQEFDSENANEVLLFGGGFLGSHVVLKLMGNPNTRVTVIDESDPISIMYNPDLSFIWNKVADRITLKHSSFNDLENVRELLTKTKFNNVVFAHSVNDKNWIVDNPVNAAHINIIFTSQVIDMLRRYEFNGRLVHLSSWSVYGAQDLNNIPFKENLAPNPISFRGGIRLAQENIIRTMCKQYGIIYNILRPGTICGGYTGKDNFLSTFVKSALLHETLLLHDGGKQTRDAVAVSDVMWVVNRLINAKTDEKDINNQVFNVGNNNKFNLSLNQLRTHELSVVHYANSVITLIRKLHPDQNLNTIKTTTTNPENKLRVFLDNKKTHDLLGYIPDLTAIDIISNVAMFVAEFVVNASEADKLLIRKSVKTIGERTTADDNKRIAINSSG